MDDFYLTRKIASYECGADLLLKPECFLHMCQEMAESHASMLDFGYDWAKRSGIAWVEVSGDFEFIRRPRWKESVTLRTNTGKASALQARRFVEMRDEAGHVIAKADLYWVLIDIQTRRPIPLKRTSLQLDIPCEALIDTPMREANASEEEAQATATILSTRRDIDFNAHINNSAYLIWALDTLPPDIHPQGEPRRIHIAFKRESYAGQSISIQHSVQGTRSTHTLSSEGDIRAVVEIAWQE